MNSHPRPSLVAILLAATLGTIWAANPSGDHVKVISTNPLTARALRARGAKLLVDYGSFQLFETSDATATAASPGGAEIRTDMDRVELNTGVLQTKSNAVQSLRRPVTSFVGKRLHLIQFIGPILPKWHAALRSAGVEVVSYIPQNTYLVYGDAASLQRAQASTELAAVLQWDGGYLDEYKIQPAAQLLDASGTRQEQKSDLFAIQLYVDEVTNTATMALIDGLRTREPLGESRVLNYRNLIVPLNVEDLPKIAARPDVISIHPFIPPRKRDERQGQIIAGNLIGNNPTGPGYLAWLTAHGFNQTAFSASGFVVDVTDSGIDNGTQHPNHFGLYQLGDRTRESRVVYNRLEGYPQSGYTRQAIDGHGNINAHIIGGYNDLAYSPHVDAAGFHYGLGIAPFVKLGSSVIFAPDNFTNPDIQQLLRDAYLDGARISSNSWGAGTHGAYDIYAQIYDALVRDTQPDQNGGLAVGHQEMVVVFSAGNSGPTAGTIGSPGVAKNVITVGAAENVQLIGGKDGCNLLDTDSNSANDIIGFSSRGPCTDGRTKPDIVAPGTRISGGVWQAANPLSPTPGVTGTADPAFRGYEICGGVNSAFFPSVGQEFYTTSSGTSHSCPAVAGAAALARQDFINKGLTPPSPAMTKALLAVGARYMNGSGAAGSLPSPSQGMGMVNLGTMFDGTPRFIRDQAATDKFTATGQTRTFNLVVRDNSKPVRIAVAWTDAPGSTTGNAYHNDLNLTVTAGAATYLGNVFSGAMSMTGGSADTKNNLECVFLPAGTSGAITVTVTAANINSDGVPGDSDPLDQDFALYAYNLGASGIPAVEAAGFVISAESILPANGRIDLGENVTVDITLKNGGAAATSNLVATLQNSGGVINAGGAQVYGVIAPGSSGTQSFTFTGAAATGNATVATLNLTDNGVPAGSIAVTMPGARVATPVADGTTIVGESFSPQNNLPDLGETVIFNLAVKNIGDVPLVNAVGTVSGYPPLNYGTIAPGQSVARPLTYPVGAAYPDLVLSLKMQLQDDAGDHGTLTFDDIRTAKRQSLIVDHFTLTSESASPANNRPDFGELVTASITFQNVGETSFQDLKLSLVPYYIYSDAPLNVYESVGPLASGATLTKPYTFTGDATCGSAVGGSFSTMDGNTFIPSPASFHWQAGSTIVASANSMNIPKRGTAGAAAIYPSAIQVSGLTGTIIKLNVRLTNINHTFPADLDFLLVGPNGQKVMLLSDCGGNFEVHSTVTIDDSYAPYTQGDALTEYSYHPTDLNTANDTLPAVGSPPPPPPPYANALGVFTGTSPNGTWYLYASDHDNGDYGSLDGWELIFTTTTDNCPNTSTDIATTITGVPATVAASQTVTATVKVTNNTPNVATASHVLVALPAGHSLLSVIPSQGSYNYQSNMNSVDAQFGTIPGLSSAQVVLRFVPNTAGSKMLQGFAQILQKDNNSANDNASVSFTAQADTDSDGDGMPDGFESSNGFNPNDPADAAADSDGDGRTNLQEYLAGTDPHDPNSALRITSFSKPFFGYATITFQTVTGRNYRIERCDSLETGSWVVVQSGLQGSGTPIQFTDYGSFSYVQQFYRVVAVMP